MGKESGKYNFTCSDCKAVHKMNGYAIAQTAMGHEIVFTCSCGNKIYL